MSEPLRVGTRQWDHVFPIAMGDVGSPSGRQVDLTRLDHTPDLWTDSAYVAGETSLSRYIRRRVAGDDSVIALPIFLMRGFRHRCIIVPESSEARAIPDLARARIGVTGWPDSGNTWTRALLTESGIELSSVEWTVGRLTPQHPVTDRFDGVRPRSDLSVRTSDKPMTEMLADGQLDAVFSPFLPPGFRDPDSGMRLLFDDVTREEQKFLQKHGYVPGIHVLAVRAEALRTDPTLPNELGCMFRQSEQVAAARHRKLLDVTPWLNSAFDLLDATGFGEPNRVGVGANRTMLHDFLRHMSTQGLILESPSLDQLFPYDLTEEGEMR